MALINRAESAIFKGFDQKKTKGFAKCLGASNHMSIAPLVIAEPKNCAI
jgi:hypothetical protein